jgi:hypothetical protein
MPENEPVDPNEDAVSEVNEGLAEELGYKDPARNIKSRYTMVRIL